MEININLNNVTSKQEKSDQTLKTAEGKTSDAVKTKEKKASEDIKKGLKAAVIFSYSKQAVTSIASSRISMIGSTYGDEAFQNRVSNIYSKSLDVGGSVISSAIAFSANPIIGAIVTGLAVLQKTVSAYSASMAWAEQKRDETISNSRRAERLGIVSSGLSRRNY